MSDNYAEETKPLFKLLRTEAFRFVIVRYNHSSFVQQLEKDLHRLFPERPIKKIDAAKFDYPHISNAYFSLNNGFFFIENFDDALKEDRDSLNKETPQYAKQNERRRGITAGLNLRRDKLAKFPIALFVFLPASAGELHAKVIMEKMPDLWSFRSWVLDLEKEVSIEADDLKDIDALKWKSDMPTEDNPIKSVDAASKVELNRLLSLLEKTPDAELAYRLTLLPQIVEAAIATGAHEQAFATLDTWEALANEQNKANVWLKKGEVYTTIGQFDSALNYFEQAKRRFDKNEDVANTAACLGKLGETYATLGNLDKALDYYKAFSSTLENALIHSPNNVAFKNGLARSFAKLGETHSALGNLDKALAFYEAYNQLEKELYTNYPTNLVFKNGLAISYSKLGQTQSELRNFDKALGYYEERNRLGEELHAAFPTNVEFKNGLAISYGVLGQTHAALGNLDKALGFYVECNRLVKELNAAFPTNLIIKNGLAISYSKLGQTHSTLGDLDKALEFYKEYNRLEKELYAAFPMSVGFKNGLALSLAKLGQFSKYQLKDNEKARTYFKQAEALWQELVRDAPMYVKFQKFLVSIQKDLSTLD
jgi:tetratricopeptide (TPR) repeat protein